MVVGGCLFRERVVQTCRALWLRPCRRSGRPGRVRVVLPRLNELGNIGIVPIHPPMQ